MADVNITLIDFGERGFTYHGENYPRYCIFARSHIPALFSYVAESIIYINDKGVASWLKNRNLGDISRYKRKPLSKQENKELIFTMIKSTRYERPSR